MKLIIDFYKDLDTINLIIFWGIILVILLLLIFSIIIANKNKRLRRIIIDKTKEIEESKNELAIKQDITNETKTYNIDNNDVYLKPYKAETNYSNDEININKDEINIDSLVDEETPINEETTIYNIENNNDDFKEENNEKEEININNIENNNIYIENTTEEDIPIKQEELLIDDNLPSKEEFIVEEHVKPTKEIILPTGPYQRNVLREMSSNQTSPIGITKREPNPQREILNRDESHTTINNIEIIEDSLPTETYKNNYQEEMNNSKKMINQLYETEQRVNEEIRKENNYLKELSKKIEDSADRIERTAYEIKQEEDAIISYDELMRKKDSLKIEDDEDAVISIEELKKKKMEEERIYNITKAEENDEFISELKDFRSDL